MGNYSIEEYSQLAERIFSKDFQLVPLLDGNERKGPAGTANNDDYGFQNLMEKLRSIKRDLNRAKAQINDIASEGRLKAWRSHTLFTHPAKGLPQKVAEHYHSDPAEQRLITQAYCKFVQMNQKYRLVERSFCGRTHFRTVHLCEAPGAFVIALKDCLLAQEGLLPCSEPFSKWDWLVNSLNPYHEWNDPFSMLTDDSLIFNNIARTVFGPDDTGNVLNWTKEYSESLGKFDLITADGGINCTDNPAEQESMVLSLISKEIEIALQCLNKGGNFLIKMFTFFEERTVQLLITLMNNFRQVICTKPPSSKPGNSELYVICFDFVGSIEPPVFDPLFMKSIEMCANYFALWQMEFINFNVKKFKRISVSEKAAMEITKFSIIEKLVISFSNWTKSTVSFVGEESPWSKLWNEDPDELISRFSQWYTSFVVDQERHPSAVDELKQHNLNVLNIDQMGEFLWARDQQKNENTVSYSILLEQKKNFLEERERKLLEDSVVYYSISKESDSSEITRNITNSLFMNPSLISRYPNMFRDLCQPSNHDSAEDFIDFPDDDSLVVETESLGRKNWLALLERIFEKKLHSLTLKFPRNTLVQSRFSASVLYALFQIFRIVRFKQTSFEFKMNSSKIPLAGEYTMERIYRLMSEKPGVSILQFIPLEHLGKQHFFDPLTRFNFKQIASIKSHVQLKF